VVGLLLVGLLGARANEGVKKRGDENVTPPFTGSYF
jgi:hypothetical protein